MLKPLFIVAMCLFSSLIFSKEIHQERSLYRNIIVEDKNDVLCLQFNTKSTQLNQSCIYKSAPNKLFFNYVKMVFSSLLYIDKPNNVLIIGLGGGTLSNVIHQLYPNASINNVEIDPAVVKVARKYFHFIETNKVISTIQDGRIFIKRAALKQKKYDWIILDAFNGDYIPEHLLTKEFFEEVKSILSPGGIIAANTFSSSKLYDHESATYYAVFGDFINVSRHNRSNRIILAGLDKMPTETEISKKATWLEPRLSTYNIDIQDIRKIIYSTQGNHDWPTDTKVLTDQYSPANLLNN
ncbi:methyltransferase domain-containing protein [Marinomonas rhizomae]|uniref:Spermidine synthase n=1 Tax=Marinomonas rhizomae TaxID=491948 RepID=A0A366J6N0_9GAMM|nr:fused MFS/spermidine synthase [Marinomonas rhizomae]RBP82517.1 spermidine synthase [Marinomonas rhizomae]RNF73696.1 methyltransferase domain-containing protein [Marinomonas rhizomae]